LLNNYFEGKKMNRYDSLKKLYSDIEVLESAGLYKAANVLHKKFVKEAQAQGAFGGIVTQDAKNFMMELDKAFNSGQPTLGVIQKAERAGLPPQELQALKNHAAKIRTQSNNDFNSQYPNTGYQTAEDTPATPARMPKMGPAQLATSTPNNIEPMPERPDPTETQQQPVAQDNFRNFFTEQSDTASFVQQQNTVPNLKQIEDPIYQQAIKKIANLLNTRVPNNRIIAQNIYEQTIGKFQDERRKKAFADQFQKLVSKNFPQNRPA
jgi:hypothetical protein